jgi:uncharacterized protein YjiS (DUF1127 family)
MNTSVCSVPKPPDLPTIQAHAARSEPGHAQVLLIRALDALFAWQDRGRERRRLGRLDERLLHDIGVDRASADAEAFKPFWRD